jgi:hypothetical protein
VHRAHHSSPSYTKIGFFTLLSSEEFVDEARLCGHGYVAKTRTYSDLLPALEAALGGEFFSPVTLRSLRSAGRCRLDK